jgi:hydrogenase small subunit
MELTRRDFLRASSAIAAAFSLPVSNSLYAAPLVGETGSPPVVWLQAQTCSGCSVSLLNSIYTMTAADLLTKTISLKYHPTLMAASGPDAVSAAQAAYNAKGYILVVEGAIPTSGQGKYCYLWPGLTAMQGVQDYARNASYIIAVGTCASFVGVAGGSPNPTGTRSLGALVGTTRVINVSGCPTHPDWIVGTIAYILKNKKAPELDSLRRPKLFYANTVHSHCPYREEEDRCLYRYGCKGKKTYCDCSVRKWSGGAANSPGVNWCVLGGNPCIGCTESSFPDGMSPFYARQSGGGDD